MSHKSSCTPYIYLQADVSSPDIFKDKERTRLYYCMTWMGNQNAYTEYVSTWSSLSPAMSLLSGVDLSSSICKASLHR